MVAVLVATFVLTGGVGLLLIFPGAFVGRSAVRYREVSKLLRRAREPASF